MSFSVTTGGGASAESSTLDTAATTATTPAVTAGAEAATEATTATTEGTGLLEENSQQALENYFTALQNAMGNTEDVARVMQQGREVFTPEAWESIEKETYKILAMAAQNEATDVFVTELVGTIATGGISGRLGVKGSNVLVDPGEVPPFSLTALEGVGRITGSILNWISSGLDGFVKTVSLGALDKSKGILGEHHKDGKKYEEGDEGYALMDSIPTWLHPFFRIERQTDGSIIQGRQTSGQKIAEGVGTAAGLVVGPAKFGKGFNAAIKTAQSSKALVNFNRGLDILRVGLVGSKAPGVVFRTIMDAMRSRALPTAGGWAATYVSAEEMVDALFDDNDVQFKDEQAREDAKYWFAGNYIFTLAIAKALEKYAHNVPGLRTVAGKWKIIDVLLAEAGTTGIIAAGTVDAWYGKIDKFIAEHLPRALETLGLGDFAITDADVDDSVAANRGGLIMRRPHPTNNIILGGR